MAEPINFSLIDSILKGVTPQPQGASPQGAAPAQAAPAVTPPAAPADIPVEGKRLPQDMGFGIIKKGPLSAGHTLGNILGSIGDALLINGGAKPIYHPALQQFREATALQDFRSNPQGALDQFVVANPEAGLKAFQQQDVLKNQQARTEAYQQSVDNAIAVANAKAQEAFNGRVASQVHAANAETYPALYKHLQETAARLGFQLPVSDDYAIAQQQAMGEIPIEKQVSQENLQDYRGKTLAQRASTDAQRIAIARANSGTAASNAASNRAYRKARLAQFDRAENFKEAHPRGKATGITLSNGTALVFDPKDGRFKLPR